MSATKLDETIAATAEASAENEEIAIMKADEKLVAASMKFDEKIAAAGKLDSSQIGGMSEQQLIEKQAKDEKELERSKRVHVHWAWVILVWGLCISVLVLSVVVLWHYIGPEKWRWLPVENVKTLSTGAVSIAIGFMLRNIQRFF